MRPAVKQSLGLFALGVLQLLGLSLFSKGFFPYKQQLAGYASFETAPSSPHQSSSSFIEPEFDRLVFVLIDALRNDFILGENSGFKFVNSLIEKKTALPFTARATAPTVTLPRIKALTTGTIPSFLDAILNIAESDTSSSLEYQDSWLYQLKHARNNTIHFFGDDTWIRLFPGLFTKQDGTTSFYVSDTVQVDYNVTRHIQTDLLTQDWDTVILHYLGLDHVGHLGGPKSPLMIPKQEEMDHAIEEIYHIVYEQDKLRFLEDANAKGTLIVVCGDHGMNEVGNHGGSSIEEISAALVFMSPKFETSLSSKRYTEQEENQPHVYGFPIIDQIDIVPTLTSLFGAPIPKNNLGKLITDFYTEEKGLSVLRALQLNAYQLGQLLIKTVPEVSRYLQEPLDHSHTSDKDVEGYAYAFTLHEKAIENQLDTDMILDAIHAYRKFIRYAQSQLVNTASDYALSWMISGITLMVLSVLVLCYWYMSFESMASSHYSWSQSKFFTAIFMSGYVGSLFSSSFVEEERYVWSYFSQTLFVLLALQSFRATGIPFTQQCKIALLSLLQLPLMRIAMEWNHWMSHDSNQSNQWHYLAFSLVFYVSLSSWSVFSIGQRQRVDASGSAAIIQLLCKAVFFLASSFTAFLVMAYKMRAEDTMKIPALYTDLLSFDVIQQLDQVELGRLVFNYGGATFLMLNAVLYVNKYANLLNLNRTQEQHMVPLLYLLLYTCTPIFILLTRSQNAFLLSIYAVQFYLMKKWQYALTISSPVPIWLLGVIILCQIHSAFFTMGHSNSIASIDLSSAYIGVDSYNTTLIGLLTFCSNWSGSIWWTLAGWSLVAGEDHTETSRSRWWHYNVILSAAFGIFLTFLSVSVTILREHLFIWTVFSPKYLYQIAWTALAHWFIQVFIGSIMVAVWSQWWQQDEIVEEEMDDYQEYEDTNDNQEHEDIDHHQEHENVDFSDHVET
ncbi:alkaline-phosphatase-like protein [Spinellus fusiger]|nr:alkaline-phosphatase-like protein [Spinellus fusiger]